MMHLRLLLLRRPAPAAAPRAAPPPARAAAGAAAAGAARGAAAAAAGAAAAAAEAGAGLLPFMATQSLKTPSLKWTLPLRSLRWLDGSSSSPQHAQKCVMALAQLS